MAFVDIYAAEATATSEYAEIDCVDELAVPTLQALLPPGVAWTREQDADLTALVRALSYEFTRVKMRSRDLIEESDPRTVTEMIADYERVYGLDGSGTLPARRVALHGKMLGFVTPSIPNLTSIAAGVGYVISIHEYKYTDLYSCISTCTDSLYTYQWLFVWTVTTPSGALNATLTDVLQAVTPLHTLLIMNFV